MLILCMLIVVYGQYTIYPTKNSTFQYPLDKVFQDKGFVYDILESQSPFSIQQAIVQGSTQTLPNIGNILYTSESQDNYFATLSYQADFYMGSVFQVGHSGELILQLTYTVNASLYTCYNLALYRNDSVIINCIQHQSNFVTLFSFGQVNTLNVTNITIKPEQVQHSAISIQRNQITFYYQFENYIDIYYSHFNQQFILYIEQHQVLNGTYLEIYQNRQGVVFALQNDSITIYYDTLIRIKAPQNMTFIDFEVSFYSWGQEYITIYLLSCHQIESLHVYQNGTYQYHSQATFKQEYTRIFTSMNSILLYGEKQLAYFKIDEDGYIQYYNYLNKKTKCENLIYIWGPQVLYCIDSQHQYTPHQQGAPYLYSKNGVQEKGTLKLITTDIDGFTDIVSVNYNPLQPNDQGIYYQYENQEKQYKVEGRRKFTYLDLSQVIVGSNLTYGINEYGNFISVILARDRYGYGIFRGGLCSIIFSQFSFAWVQACFYDLEVTVEILDSQFDYRNNTVYIQKVQLLADITQVKILPYNNQNQNVIQIIAHSRNKIYIYHFKEFISLDWQSTIDMTLQNESIEIQDIQTLYDTIIILTQNPNRVYYTFGRNQQQGIIQLQLDYSREVLQIATNTQSYVYLLVNQVGQAQIVSFWQRGQGQGYKIIQKIKYPDGYLKSIIGPVQQGIFFYFYTETQSELYFLQKEFIKQIDVQHNMFFTKVDTSRYQLVQNKLTYSYSNKFFYVLCQDNKGNQLLNIYQGSYQAIKILIYSQYLSYLRQIKYLASTVYQETGKQYGADLILISDQFLNQRYLIYHKPYLLYRPEFTWQLNQQINVTYTVNNNFTQIQVWQALLINQSYLQLTAQPTNLLGQTYKIIDNKFNFEVSKMFKGPIRYYKLSCEGCEIQQIQLPIDDNLETSTTFKQDYDSYVLKEDKTKILYLLDKIGALYSLNLNNKTKAELLVEGMDSDCSNLFLEINTNNPSWACYRVNQIIFYTYNPSNKKIQYSPIDIQGIGINCSYSMGYLQLFSQIYSKQYYSIIQYKIINDKQEIHILINKQPLYEMVSEYRPIILDNNSSNLILGCIGITEEKIQYLIIANIAVNETYVKVYPFPLTSFNTQNTFSYQSFQIGRPEKRLNNIIIRLYQSGLLNPQIVEVTFNNDGSYKEQQLLCHINLINLTLSRNNNIQATSNGKKLIILQNKISYYDIYQQSELLIYDLELCGQTKLVNPYQQLKLSLNIYDFSSIQYLSNDLLIYMTKWELSIIKSTGQVTGTYKETQEDPIISIIAQNPVNQVSQSLAIHNNINKSSSGFAWYWIVLIIISSLVAAFYVYVFIRQKVFTRNVPRNQQNTYVEFR